MSDGREAQLHQRACHVMAEASELPATARSAFIDRECAGDGALRERVLELLRHHAVAPTLQPLVDSSAAVDDPTAGDDGEPSTLPPPAAIGPFRIVREVGHGSHGIVYEAWQEHPLRRVALKVMRPGWLAQTEAGRFEREVAALARFSHPGIAAIHEAGHAPSPVGPLPWFAMELVDGQPIDEWTAARRTDRRGRVELLRQVCDAVDHAHSRQVIHRDLKPANVLVRGDGRVKVLDFGVAGLVDAVGGDSPRMTRSGAFVGTLAYLSPEQALGAGAAVDARSDVYSLGVIAYELLSGRLPFDPAGHGLTNALRHVAEFEPPALGSVDPALAGDLENIVRKAMAKEPARRYATAQELSDDLGRWLDHRPVHAHAPSTWYVLAKLAQRHRGLVAGALIAVAALVAGVVMLSVGLQHAREALEASEERRLGAIRLVRRFQQLVKSYTQLPGGGELRRKAIPELRALFDSAGLQPQPGESDPLVLETGAEQLDLEADVCLEDGDLDAALAKQREVLATFERLAAQSPDDVALARRLSVAIVKVGDVAKQRGDLAEADRLYARQLALDEALVARHPEHAGCRDDLCHSYARRGDLERLRGNLDEARAWADRRVAACEELLALAPTDESRFNFGQGCLMRAGMSAGGLDAARAEELLHRARAVVAPLLEAPDAHRRYHLLDASIRLQLAAQTQARGLLNAAEGEVNAIEIHLVALLQQHPDDCEVWLARWHLEERRAALDAARGDFAEACRRLEEYLARLRKRSVGAVGVAAALLDGEAGNVAAQLAALRAQESARGER